MRRTRRLFNPRGAVTGDCATALATKRDPVKHILLSLLVAVSSLTFVAVDAQAKRLGGGSTSGMKRQTPPPQPAQAVPAKPAPAATPGPANAAAPAAAPPKRSWMGPLAGLAAGLGIAALMSHLGMGAEFGNILTMILLAVAAVFLVRFLLRRFGPNAAGRQTAQAPQGMQFAGAGAGAGGGTSAFPGNALPPQQSASGFGSGGAVADRAEPGFGAASVAPVAASTTAAAAASTLPEGFDAPAFERIAKLIFIRMQAANDSGNLDDLRQFATPEMFANFRLELQDRKGAVQQTDVVQLDAQVLEFAQEADSQVVSVRFHGLVREEKDSAASPFDEIWHLVKPTDGSREWAIAGIAQSSTDA